MRENEAEISGVPDKAKAEAQKLPVEDIKKDVKPPNTYHSNTRVRVLVLCWVKPVPRLRTLVYLVPFTLPLEHCC